MAQAFLFLIDGFEEIEALATVDILRRGGVEVKTVSLMETEMVHGSHHIPVIADCLLAAIDCTQADMLIIPGGTVAFNEHDAFKNTIIDFSKTGKDLAAICAAPMVLGGLSLLEGKKATCYPSFEQYLQGADVQHDVAVVSDGNIITGRGPGVAMEFALVLLERLIGKEMRDEVSQGLLLQ